MKQAAPETKVYMGWKEWISLPRLGIPAIKAKLDTGARTSALHTYQLETFRKRGKPKVRFGIHPLQKNRKVELCCEAEVIDRRLVSDSSGHREWRYVIRTPLQIGENEWEIEITLTNRDTMRFRMLLGRTALAGQAVVDPQSAYLMGRDLARSYRKPRRRGRVK